MQSRAHHSRRRCPLRIAALLFGLVLLGSQLSDARAASFRDPADDLRVDVLDNGLTVLTLEDRTTPVASFQVWVNVGSVDETRYTGIAHLFEHMMFKGTERLGPEEFTRRIEARGGRLNAFTSHDVTVYFENVTSETLPLVIELEAERFANLIIDDALLESERQVVLEERRMRTEDSPSGLAFEALLGTAFLAHPYRRPVIGWRSDVERVDVETCREFYRTYYAPNNLVVAVAGDFDTEPTLARIRRTFGRMEPATSIPRNPTLEPEQRGPRRARVEYPVQGPLIMAAFHAPPTGHADGPALDVLAEVLSGGRSSRLYRRMVRNDALALGAGGGYWELHEAGLFFLRVGVRPDAGIDAAEAALLDELAEVRKGRVSDAELERAKRALEVAWLDDQRTAYQLASRIGRDWTAFARVRPLAEVLDAIRAVTAEDVQRVAKRYLAPQRSTTVRVVPPVATPARSETPDRAAP